MGIGAPLMRHPVGLQRIDAGQADLDRVETENIGRQTVQPILFPCLDIAACRCLEPRLERYNGFFGQRMFHAYVECLGYSGV